MGKLTVASIVMVGALLAVLAGQARESRRAERSGEAVDVRGVVAFVDVNLVPMVDEGVLSGQTVLVRDGTIADIGPANRLAVPGGAFRIDGRGRYLMPGLTDAHTHISFEEDLLLYVANGVTTIVNLGNEPEVPILAWRGEVARGERLGPNLYVARFVDGRRRQSPRNAPFLLSRPEQAREFVTETKAAGYDLIKAYNSLSLSVYRALMDEAHAQGIAVVGHGVRAAGMKGLLEAGQVMIAHGEEYLYTHFSRSIDTALVTPAIAMTLEAGAYVVPNLSAYEAIALQWGKPSVLEELLEIPELRYVHPFWSEYWARGRYTSRTGSIMDRLEFLRTMTGAFNDAGVPLLLGTDSPSIPGMLAGYSIFDDMRNMVQSGLSPYDVLRAGTRNAGEFINRHVQGSDLFGTVAVGARADLLLLEADPLADVENVKRRAGVMVRGQWLSEARLVEMLEELAGSFEKGEG